MEDDQRSQFAAMIVAILVSVKVRSIWLLILSSLFLIMRHDCESSLKGDFQEVLS